MCSSHGILCNPLCIMRFVTLQDGKTALIEACLVGKSEVMSVLLKAGARTDIKDRVKKYYLCKLSMFIAV